LDGLDAVVYCASMGFGHVPNLIAQLQAAGVKRALFTSTTAIFTSLPSASRAVRIQAEAAVQASSLDWSILRPTMIYGTARDRNISRLLRVLKRWPVFPICGNGLWQPIYVEDLADAVVTCLDSRVAVGKAYNVAGAYPIRFDELVRTAAHAIGRQVHLARIPVEAGVLAAQLTRGRIVTPEQMRRLAEDKAFDYSDATRDFGFHTRSFAEGVRLEARGLGL
jgi:nucleoside-diphosphate-sugar epimerase